MTSSTRRFGFGVITAALLASAAAPLAAVDFVRGDANDDGQVTIADAQRILYSTYLSGEGIGCGDAADADDDGIFGLVDAVFILEHIVGIGGPPPAPFPLPGPDGGYDPEIDGYWPCATYGGGEPLADPGAALRVLDAVAAGGGDPRVTLVLGMSNSERVAGYYAELASGGILTRPAESHRSGLADLSGTLSSGYVFLVPATEAGAFRLAFLGNLAAEIAIPPRPAQLVLEAQFCLAPGTPAGGYPIVLRAGELADYTSGRAIAPRLIPGTLTVLEDVAEGACAIELTDPRRPDLLDVTFRLGETSGTPGGEAVVPFIVRASDQASTRGVEFSIDFDEEVVQLTGIETVIARPDGAPAWMERFQADNSNERPGNAGIDEGYVAGVYIISYWAVGEPRFPVNEDFVVVNLHFLIAPGAAAGATEVRFLDGGRLCGTSLGPPSSPCYRVENRIVAGHEELPPEFVNSFVFVNGRISIVPDVTVFVRGDSNRNGRVELADAQSTLNHLFLGGPPPRCHDASDANDDGKLDISDPVGVLNFLFLGGGPLPPPAGSPGPDPSPDSLPGCGNRD